METLARESQRQVEAHVVRSGAERAKAACVFYPCDTKLAAAEGVWNSSFCDGVTGVDLLQRMVEVYIYIYMYRYRYR